jgi:protein bicaudal C
MTASVDTEKISQLMQSLDVFINVRHKPKQSTLSVIIKGIERKASNIYKARKQLLGLDEPMVIADIPITYYIANASNVFQYGHSNNDGSTNNLLSGVPENFSSILNVNTQNSPYCVSPISHSPNSLGLSSHWGLPHHYIPSMCPYPYSHLNHLLTTQHMLHNSIMGTSHGPHGLSNHVMPPGIGAFHHNNVPTNFSGIHGLNANSLMDNKDGSSAYSSLSSVSSSLSSPAISPRNISPVNPTDANTNLPDLSSMLSDLPVTDRRAPGCEKKSLEMAAQQNLTPFDYEQKKLLATKAMQNKSGNNDFRVPTSAWSGYGLSQSIPTITTSDLNKEMASHPSDLWKEPTTPVFSTEMDFGSIISSKDRVGQIGMASNYMDHTPTSHLNKITSSHRFNDLGSMLTSIGLEKYIQMNKRTSPFSGSAAPGAERKASSSSAPTSSMGKCNLDTKW